MPGLALWEEVKQCPPTVGRFFEMWVLARGGRWLLGTGPKQAGTNEMKLQVHHPWGRPHSRLSTGLWTTSVRAGLEAIQSKYKGRALADKRKGRGGRRDREEEMAQWALPPRRGAWGLC
jgi:hypothetical protein